MIKKGDIVLSLVRLLKSSRVFRAQPFSIHAIQEQREAEKQAEKILEELTK